MVIFMTIFYLTKCAYGWQLVIPLNFAGTSPSGAVKVSFLTAPSAVVYNLNSFPCIVPVSRMWKNCVDKPPNS